MQELLAAALLVAAFLIYMSNTARSDPAPMAPIIIRPAIVQAPKENVSYHYPDQEVVRVAVDRNAAGPARMVYNQVGYMTSKDGGQVLALYGKPSYTRRGRYFYYTILNDIKVPVYHEGRDCMTEVACDEVYDGYELVVPDYNPAVKWVVRLYPRTYF